MLTFWIIAVILCAVACLAVLLPFARKRTDEHGADAFDIEVYRDQMVEVDSDESRGIIGGGEAAEARAEIGRRILQTGRFSRNRPGKFETAGKWLATIAVLSIPVVSLGIYAVIGSPDIPARPLHARLDGNPAENTIEELIARAEKHLVENPRDGRGWDVIAPIYVRVRRYRDAERAYRNAIRIGGSSAERQSGLGEAILAIGGGLMTPEVRDAFEAAVAHEPRNLKARFFLAMAMAQQGKAQEAVAGWREVAADAPELSPWGQAALNAIAALQAGSRQTAGPRRPGPDAEDLEAASRMSPEDRAAMIETMVAGLALKLEENPLDREGWRKLIRSYVVMNRPNEARAALGRGMEALKEVPGASRALAGFAAGLGVERTN